MKSKRDRLCPFCQKPDSEHDSVYFKGVKLIACEKYDRAFGDFFAFDVVPAKEPS